MVKAIGIVIFALFCWVSAEPLYFSSPYYPSRYAAALTAPVSTTVVTAPVPTVPAVPALPTLPALPAVPTVPGPANPITSLSAYAYGSGYSVQELPVVNAASAPLVYGGYPYGAPYPLAYTSDYFYRR